MRAFRGNAPNIDGKIAPGEYDDGTPFEGTTAGWKPQFSPTTDPKDLSLRGWVKHDGQNLYFAFDVTDDVIYGVDIARWLPDENPHAHELSPRGFPWFGDGIELLIDARNHWTKDEGATGDGSSFQMVLSTHKSRLSGLGQGGLLEGEPRSKASAWNTYQRWIKTGAMRAAVRVKDRGEGRGYVVEWMVKGTPCLQVAPGQFWNATRGETRMGLNLAVADLDEKARGAGSFGNFHHEDWWAGEKDTRTQLRQWGTLILDPRSRARAAASPPSAAGAVVRPTIPRAQRP